MKKKILTIFILILLGSIFLNINIKIAEAILKAIFEPFVALDEKDKKISGEPKIIVKLNERTLRLYFGDSLYRSYPITIGKKGDETPVGEWKIINKGKKPPDGPLGSRWMGINCPWGVYGIHGTNKPGEIGLARSLGCIRLHNEYVEELYQLVDIGTRVYIIGKWEEVKIRRLLRKGSKGKDVMQLQRNLRKYGFDTGYLNAHYNDITEGAVKELETQFGLIVDGVADTNVLHLLNLD